VSYKSIGKGIVKRSEKRVVGLFIDGIGLDRATRRMNRKVDLAQLVKGVTSGLTPLVARYYTIVPFEDDSRQRAYLDAVSRAGLRVIVKRLPPKGITRQVSTDAEMAADIVAFALGHSAFSDLSEWKPHGQSSEQNNVNKISIMHKGTRNQIDNDAPINEEVTKSHVDNSVSQSELPEKRSVIVVCPNRDIAYPISLLKELNIDTINADFAQLQGGDVLKSAAKWIDLSTSETIWREN
jgi:NYN domain